MSLEDKVRETIRQGDLPGCVALLAGTNEEERTALSAAVMKLFDLAHRLCFSRDPSKAAKALGVDGDKHRRDLLPFLEVARFALLRTMKNPDVITKYAWRSVPTSDDMVLAALEGRPPELIHEWAVRVCEVARTRWLVVRRLVREGRSARPETDGYVLGLIQTAARRNSWRGENRPPLFEEDPALLDEEVWRVFEVEGDRESSLTGGEHFWHKTLLELQASGRLNRARMLDATLSALARDFPQHKAGFHSRFHDALAPTPAEVAARASAYVELLASRISPTVSLATRVVESLPADLDLDVSSFARAATSAARSARGQSTALALLRLLAPRAEDPEALEAVTAFLEHPAVDVVDAALAILETSRPDLALARRVASLVAAMPASRRARASAWLAKHDKEPTPEVAAKGGRKPVAKPTRPAKPAEEPLDASPADVKRAALRALAAAPPGGPWPRVTLDDRSAPRLDPERRVVPIADAGELLAMAARVLEEPNDVLSYERLLDGMSRLGAPLTALPVDAIKPLAKRAAKLAGRAPHFGPSLVRRWLEGGTGDDLASKHVSTRTFIERRGRNVLARLARGETRALLSMPSTEAFFVDARELARRVKALADEAIDAADAVTALLRLAPEGRKEAAKALRGVAGPLAAAVRHALGAEGETPDRKQPALWLAAARARGGDDPVVEKAFPRVGSDAGEAARIAFAWEAHRDGERSWARFEVTFAPAPASLGAVPPDAFAVLLATHGHGGDGAQFGPEAVVRAEASLYPAERRTFLAHGAARLALNVDWDSAEWENHVFIEALLDPDVPLDEPALKLLAIALNAKEARENALATDVLIAAISDGRIVGPELGRAMAFFWDPIHDEVRWSHRLLGGRWARTFASVAHASPLHAEVVRRVIEAHFGAPPRAPAPDAHALLQLWLDLAVEARVGVPDRAALAPYDRGKAKKIAAQLLALEGTASVHASAAHALALEGRRSRAARWTRWTRG